jgi:hypothetical protein
MFSTTTTTAREWSCRCDRIRRVDRRLSVLSTKDSREAAAKDVAAAASRRAASLADEHDLVATRDAEHLEEDDLIRMRRWIRSTPHRVPPWNAGRVTADAEAACNPGGSRDLDRSSTPISIRQFVRRVRRSTCRGNGTCDGRQCCVIDHPRLPSSAPDEYHALPILDTADRALLPSAPVVKYDTRHTLSLSAGYVSV